MNRESSKRTVIMLMAAVIVAALVATWGIVWTMLYAGIIARPFGYKGNWLVMAIYGAVLMVFMQMLGGLRIGHYRKDSLLFSGIFALVLTNAIIWLQTCLLGARMFSPLPILLMTLGNLLVYYILITISLKIYYKVYPPHKVLLIYGNLAQIDPFLAKIETRPEKYIIEDRISIEEGMEAVLARIALYEGVLLHDVPAEARNDLLKYCYGRTIRVYMLPKLSDILVRGSREINLFDTPMLMNRCFGLRADQVVIKRGMDILLSAIGIVLASPLMGAVALLIKLHDRGPVLFRQSRLTLHGKVFDVFKFRSMIVDAEKDTGVTLSTQGDERVTSLGRVLRATRLDELPQLFNILIGDMSIVGPRPERPEIAAEYEQTMPEFAYRLKVKAGLTGYAQIIGKYNTTSYDKLKLDLTYIESYSTLLDVKLILMTIPILFSKESTEGIEEGKTHAHTIE